MVIFNHQLSPHGVILKFRGFPDLSSTPWGNDQLSHGVIFKFA
jgi:hypothetical protein